MDDKKVKMGKNETKETDRKKVVKIIKNSLGSVKENDLDNICDIIMNSLPNIENFETISDFYMGCIFAILQNYVANN